MLQGHVVIPDIKKGFAADVIHLVINIGTGGDTPFGGDAAIVGAGDTTATVITLGPGKQRIGISLMGDALKMGRTTGADDQVLALFLSLQNLIQYLFIAGRADVGHGFPSTGADQKKEVQHPGATGTSKVDHGRDFMGVVFGHREVDLERQIMATTRFHSSQGFLPGLGAAAKPVMLFWIKGIQADADAHGAGGLERLHSFIVKHDTIAADHHEQPKLAAMFE